MSHAQNNSRQLPTDLPIFFDDFLTRDRWKAQRQMPFQVSSLPAVNVHETIGHFVIELVAPGLSLEDLTVQLTEQGLLVEYAPPTDRFEPLSERRTWRQEYRKMAFQRGFELNTGMLDFDGMETSAEHGIIYFTFPKRDNFQGRITPVLLFSDN
jgi:HSP20 family molecular chaperone IbpA